ncbi:hypothetical protein CR194_01525 [Salipaludibacillus keqinensis]|jgi:hypothetical protein|uniref:Uncharacterized protein n=1 Tax=Salipaludibacillus keqinensis TaxID=2045207 RepID=A0A323TJ72_9BACI|nr:hypothetical protein [Salipaludibacillus keqinensis]PYZ94246.1 hypothetical protein CR194_01525 [Salipaludibacillus keqinensis]
MDKKLFYVTWKTGSELELMPVNVDSRTIQYEVEVDEKEQHKLEHLILAVNKKDVMQEHIFVRPFDETADDMDKEQLKGEVSELFQLIYELGTEKTKKYFDDMREQE